MQLKNIHNNCKWNYLFVSFVYFLKWVLCFRKLFNYHYAGGKSEELYINYVDITVKSFCSIESIHKPNKITNKFELNIKYKDQFMISIELKLSQSNCITLINWYVKNHKGIQYAYIINNESTFNFIVMMIGSIATLRAYCRLLCVCVAIIVYLFVISNCCIASFRSPTKIHVCFECERTNVCMGASKAVK